MDITQLAVSNSQSQLMYNVSVAMMAKSLDTMQTAGDNMVKMMEQSVQPNLGSNFDMTV